MRPVMFVRRGLYQFNRSINEVFFQSSMESRSTDASRVTNLCAAVWDLVEAFGRRDDYKVQRQGDDPEVNKHGGQISKATQDAIISLLAALIHRLRADGSIDSVDIRDLLVGLRDMLYVSLEVDISSELQDWFTREGYELQPLKKQNDVASTLQGTALDSVAAQNSGEDSDGQDQGSLPSSSPAEVDPTLLFTPEKREIEFQNAAYKVLHANAYLTPQTKKIMAASAMVLLGVALIGIVAVSHGGGLETIAQAYGHFGKHLGMALSGELTHHQVAAEEAAGMLVSGSAVAAGLYYGTSANPEVAVVQNVRADRLAYEANKLAAEEGRQSSHSGSAGGSCRPSASSQTS